MGTETINSKFPKTARILPVATFGIVLWIYHNTFGIFFDPALTSLPGIGHDFSGILPWYLDGYFWYLNNGFLTPPWFTPAFCAGQLFFPDPQSLFYSIGQFLTFVTDPLTAAYLALLIYSTAGYWGMHAFCRRHLGASAGPSALAGALWMFNGFSSHHYLIGHVNFGPLLLAPVLAYLLIPGTLFSPLSLILRSTTSALIIALGLHGGLGSMMLPMALSVWGMASLAAISGKKVNQFYLLGTIAATLAATICAAKLQAAINVMSIFPRSQYPLPGIAGAGDTIVSAFQMVALPESQIFSEVASRIVNSKFFIGPHELAFDLTPIPFVLCGFWFLLAPIVPAFRLDLHQLRRLPIAIHTVGLIFLTAVPLALIYYLPEWNAILKKLPIVSSTSSTFRWLAIWLPLLCCLSAMAATRLMSTTRGQWALSGIALSAVFVFKSIDFRDYYRDQPYDPSPILQAYDRATKPGFRPAISKVGAYLNSDGEPILSSTHQNDLIAIGASQAYCYNPLFGYELENLNVEVLFPGNPLRRTDGWLNFINPSCYVFPRENNCTPGARFKDTPEDTVRLKEFLTYRPWPFKKSRYQELAELISVGALLAVVTALAITALITLIKFWRGLHGQTKKPRAIQSPERRN